MGVELITCVREGRNLFIEELDALRQMGKEGKKHAARLALHLQKWASTGFTQPKVFRAIVGKPYEGKLWEARYHLNRSDGVHGYRIFYIKLRRPGSSTESAVLLMLWGKEGDKTPEKVLKEAWTRAEEVWAMERRGTFWEAEAHPLNL